MGISDPSTVLPSVSIRDIRVNISGLDREVPLVNGKTHAYVNFDNAATTPPFKSVIEKITQLSGWYGSVHRGTGFKSRLSTEIYEQCRGQVLNFVGADSSDHLVIFTGNTTCAINQVCQHLELKDNEVVLVAVSEHHSNMLPWRVHCPVEYVDAFDHTGRFCFDELERKLDHSEKKVRLVALTGASNVTGSMPPLKTISRLVHDRGAELLVDAAQLIASRPIRMLPLSDGERIDYLAFSAHKMYAPFGVGVLIGPKKTFARGRPFVVGGGTIDLVTLEEVEWTDGPEREEAGTPNLIGVVALVEAIKTLRAVGWDFIIEHQRSLTGRLLNEFKAIPEIKVYGKSDPQSPDDHGGIVSFNASGIPHALLAAVLGFEWGVGVRNGCFCAQPYVAKLLGLDHAAVQHYAALIRQGNRASLPGMVRVSFGIYNTQEEIEYFLTALKAILNKGPERRYELNPSTGEYLPAGESRDFHSYFSL